MQPDDTGPDAPASWLRNARGDLALAGVALPPGGLYEHLCFHAQQAAEKAIKAVLLDSDVDVPFTHNIRALLDLLPKGLATPAELRRAIDLNTYAVAARYPGDMEPVTEQEYKEAVALAEMVVRWAESVVGGQI